MALSKDFIVKNGLVVQTTATIQSILNSTSSNSGALQVVGGIGIGGNSFFASNVTNAGTITATNTVTITSSVVAISTTTGALQVVGGVGVGGNIYAGGRVGWVNSTTNVSAVYQYYNASTNSLDTVFG